MSGEPIVRLNNDTSRWRWACPRGHRNWEATNDHVWCQTCARQRGDGHYHRLLDKRSGDLVARAQLVVVDKGGSA
ncbi:hypothetical protein [Halorussus pelagicus]|uniref:hypothetical protein n=1 Tax=Halorussus pelagicus TaxID=2505977 RepID=UPI000FFBEFE8|nr:hypothetical protein [Halorussus pelagicus]